MKNICYTGVRIRELWLWSPFLLLTEPYKLEVTQKLKGITKVFQKKSVFVFAENSGKCKGGYPKFFLFYLILIVSKDMVQFVAS